MTSSRPVLNSISPQVILQKSASSLSHQNKVKKKNKNDTHHRSKSNAKATVSNPQHDVLKRVLLLINVQYSCTITYNPTLPAERSAMGERADMRPEPYFVACPVPSAPPTLLGPARGAVETFSGMQDPTGAVSTMGATLTPSSTDWKEPGGGWGQADSGKSRAWQG